MGRVMTGRYDELRDGLQGRAGSRGFKTLSNQNPFLKDGFEDCRVLHLVGA